MIDWFKWFKLFKRADGFEIKELKGHGFVIEIIVDGEKTYLSTDGIFSFNLPPYVRKHCIFSTREHAESKSQLARLYIESKQRAIASQKEKDAKAYDFKKKFNSL